MQDLMASPPDDSSDGMDDGMMRGQGQRQLAGGCA